MVTELTPASLLDPHNPAAFLEAQQAHTAAFNALYDWERRHHEAKATVAAVKLALAEREAELTALVTGSNKEQRDASLTLLKRDDAEYVRLRGDFVEAEDAAARRAADVNVTTAEVSNAKARMAFITAWLTAEAARREAL